MSMPQRNAPNANSPVKSPPAPEKKAEDSSSDEEEESVKPLPAKETKVENPENRDIEKGKKNKKDARRNEDENYQPQVCCCDCYLQEGVGWIAAVEFCWGLTFMFVCASNLVMAQNADHRIQRNLSPDEYDDRRWQSYGKEHSGSIIAALLLHITEIIMGVFLMIASSRRMRMLCFLWIAFAILIIIGEVALVIIDPIPLCYVTVAINPLRFYFAYIVWSLAREILVYPNGPPITVYVSPMGPRATIISQPYSTPIIVGPAYGYYPYRAYGYGYPYGYGYNADAALLTGVAVGAGVGLGAGVMAGGFCDHGGGFYN